MELSEYTWRGAIQTLGEEAAEEWRAQLPRELARLGEMWGVRPVRAMAGSTRALVMWCESPSGPVVVKLPYDGAQLAREHAALTSWPHAQMVRVHRYRPGAMSTHAIGQGETVDRERTLVDDRQLRALLSSLHCPAGDASLRSLRDDVHERLDLARSRIWAHGEAGVAIADLDAAQRLCDQLCKTSPRQLVHADLHPGNVLISSGSHLTACDPKGAIGDGAYDAATWALKADRARSVSHWLDRLATMGYERERMERWMRVIATHEAVSYANAGKGEGGMLQRLGQIALG